MGYMRHHAIVVTSWSREALDAAHVAALTCCGPHVSEVVDSPMNGERSFFVAPDGSKEGWAESDAGDAGRDAFVRWMESQRTEDGGTYLRWVEVQYGDDNRETRVVRDSDHPLTVAESLR